MQHSILWQGAAPDQLLQAAEASRVRLKGMKNGLDVAVPFGRRTAAAVSNRHLLPRQ